MSSAQVVPRLKGSCIIPFAMDQPHLFDFQTASYIALSSIQYLKNWPKIMDITGLDILSKLARLGQRKQMSPVDTITCECAWERSS
ncbi:hypothetical protein TNCV_4120761 [Trichonephila clavipes]|nr:hypothetical protein TNCV_4120761 [Trichonephila clavipes]